MQSTRAFLRLIAQVPRSHVVLLVLLMIAASATEGVGLFLLVPLLEILGGQQSGHPLVRGVTEWLAALGIPVSVAGLLTLFVTLITVRSAIQYAREQAAARIERRLIDGYRMRAYGALLRVEWQWLANTRRSDHANLLLSNVDRIGVGLTFGIGLLTSLATMIAYLLVALTLSPLMTLVAVVSGAMIFGLLTAQRRGALALGYTQSKARRSIFANVQESLGGLKIAKILGTEQRHLDQFAADTAHLREQQFAFMTSMARSRALFQIGGALFLALYLYLGLVWWRIPTPELLTVVLLFARLVPMLMAMQQQIYQWAHSMPALFEVEELLDDCSAAAEPVSGDSPVEPMPLTSAIELSHIAYNWPGRSRPAIDDVSLTIAARTTVAIMGASGSGKSSLADLLMGLLMPDSGSIAIDGVPLDAATRMGWRRSVAYVPQDVFLFHDSIRANLLWGNPAANEDALADALRRSAAEFVFDMPMGLETVVGDGGMRLSGGERQRLALARALLKHPSLLILDEATSALDVENELRIRDAFERMHGDLTVVIIGHRLPTLEHADQVVRMDRGRVVAAGVWAEVGAVVGATT